MPEVTVDVREVLLRMGYTIYSETASRYITRPLYRDSDNNSALAVDKRTGVWCDFVERIGGPLSLLVEKTLGWNGQSDKVSAFLKDKSFAVTIQNNYELGEVKKFDKMLLLKLKKDHSYWASRGIKEETVKTFEGGTTNNGRMKLRYVFPIFDYRDELIGFSGRSLLNYTNVPKWKHIGAKNNWCYPLKWNRETIETMREVILLESIGDMLALWQNGIRNTLVTFGVSISPTIIQYLLKIDTKKIIIAFNNDEENNSVGNEAAGESRLRLMQYFDAGQVTVALPPAKDFGEMDAEQITLWKQKSLLKS